MSRFRISLFIMADRYFLEKVIDSDHATLEGAEAHHLLHVMRAKPGVEVVLFDGSGAEFEARVEKCGRSSVELAVLSRTVIDRELPFELIFGVALPKGDRQKWLVEKLTELGVTTLAPIETRRGVAQPFESALDRLRKSVIEASKQCGRNRLMRIDAPQTVDHFALHADSTMPRWIAHPGGDGVAKHLDEIRGQAMECKSISVLVGPEGGFTSEEAAAAVSAGWRQIDLGTRILRVETAAIAIAATVTAVIR
jgi:16S rRNA (uracil1498-N3)-methyltransferase